MLHACACMEGRRTGHGPMDRAIHLAHAVMSEKLVLSLLAGEPLPSLWLLLWGATSPLVHDADQAIGSACY